MLDTNLTRAQIELLQTIIDEQPEATIAIDGFPVLGALLMGATPVEVIK
jgi:hypothetical protein